MAHEFTMQRRVAFAETDMAGILHFSNHFRYMEEVEHAFFRSLGLKVHAHDGGGVWGWARVEASCTFKRPVTNEDLLDLHLVVREKRSKSITYEIVFRKDGVEVARGRITAICIARSPDGSSLRAIPMPPDVAAAIDVAPIF